MTTVAIQGEAGSFSAAAARALVGDARLASFVGFEGAAACVASGGARYAVLPVSNRITGRVLDLPELIGRYGLEIVAWREVPIRQALVSPAFVRVEDLREVRSHPVALAQCGRFLRAHPHLRPIPVEDTAGAIRQLQTEGSPGVAAIGPAEAAVMHGACVLLADVSDAPDNHTRFALLRRAGAEDGR